MVWSISEFLNNPDFLNMILDFEFFAVLITVMFLPKYCSYLIENKLDCIFSHTLYVDIHEYTVYLNTKYVHDTFLFNLQL